MWMEMESTGDDNYELRWMGGEVAELVLLGVVAGQFVLHILPHLFGVN